MLFPIIPQSIIKALKIFDLKEKDIDFSSLKIHNNLKPGKKINKIDILFKKIDKKHD